MKLETDRIIGLTAMFVAVASLVALVYQTYLQRQAQHASVLPYLTFVVVSNPEGTNLAVRNTGIGPAKIEQMRILYRGKEVETDPYEFYLLSHPDAVGIGVDKVLPGRLIPAGEWVRMLEASGGEKGYTFLPELLKLFEIAEVPRAWYTATKTEGGDKAVVEITYASVYGDRWRVRSDRLVPDEL